MTQPELVAFFNTLGRWVKRVQSNDNLTEGGIASK
jgi:hypothetical protein